MLCPIVAGVGLEFLIVHHVILARLFLLMSTHTHAQATIILHTSIHYTPPYSEEN